MATPSFSEFIKSSQIPVLVDFWADWCGPCKALAPTLKEVAEHFKGKLTVIKVNVDKKQSIAAQYNIQSVPTLIIFKEGQIVMRESGALSFEQLKYHINGVLN